MADSDPGSHSLPVIPMVAGVAGAAALRISAGVVGSWYWRRHHRRQSTLFGGPGSEGTQQSSRENHSPIMNWRNPERQRRANACQPSTQSGLGSIARTSNDEMSPPQLSMTSSPLLKKAPEAGKGAVAPEVGHKAVAESSPSSSRRLSRSSWTEIPLHEAKSFWAPESSNPEYMPFNVGRRVPIAELNRMERAKRPISRNLISDLA